MMLETIHQYATERLQDGHQPAVLQKKHAYYFADLAERAGPQVTGEDQLAWLDRLHAEMDNVRAAIRWSLSDDGEIQAGLRVLGGAQRFWYLRSHTIEALRWSEQLLAAATDDDARYLPRALNATGRLLREIGEDARAIELHDDSLENRTGH